MTISSEEFVRDWGIPGELVAVDESLVFKFERQVWKVYPNCPIGVIQRYQVLTAQVAKAINSLPGIIKSRDGSIIFPFKWRVVLIEAVVKHKERPLTISRFIEGPTLDEFLHMCSDGGELHPLQQIEAMHSGYVHGALTEFCEGLNRELRTENVWFTTVNTKVHGSELIVTDVSPVVANLSSRSE